MAEKSLKKILLKIQYGLVCSSRYSLANKLGTILYKIFEIVLSIYLRQVGVVSAYIGHSLIIKEFQLGISDIDSLVIIQTPKDLSSYAVLRKAWLSLISFTPARDLSLLTEQEFLLTQYYGGGWEPMYEKDRWRLIVGKDLRIKTSIEEQPGQKDDRLRYALAQYQQLLETAIKEQALTNKTDVINVRRNLYKNYCRSVISLDPSLFAIPSQFKRLEVWLSKQADNSSLNKLLFWRQQRFFDGDFSGSRFLVPANACLSIDNNITPKVSVLHAIPAVKASKRTPCWNHNDVSIKIKPLCDSIANTLGDNLANIVLTSNGSPMGYMLIIIAKADLNEQALAEMLYKIYVIFRIYDDPFFNEHFPAKVPLLFTENIFYTYFSLFYFDRVYLSFHRQVMFGSEASLSNKLVQSDLFCDEETLAWEGIRLHRYIHQLILERQRTSLYEAVTFYVPRYCLLIKYNIIVSTIEEAVEAFAEIGPKEFHNVPLSFYQQYGQLSFDATEKIISETDFESAWPLFQWAMTENLNQKFTAVK